MKISDIVMCVEPQKRVFKVFKQGKVGFFLLQTFILDLRKE